MGMMEIGKAGPKIYSKMQVQGQMAKIAEQDVVALLAPITRHGFGWTKNGVLESVSPRLYEAFDTPWCHARHLPNKNCGLDHQILFNTWGIVHPRCMSCWKTCMGLKNFDELMTWRKVQLNEMDFAAKCGIELRDYTPRHYGAYHYANSIEEGREIYTQVLHLAKKYLSEETVATIILKRACTEYELHKGPSATWHLTELDERIIKAVDCFVNYPITTTGQNKELAHPHVMMRWLCWAHANKDMSYLPYNNNTPLFPSLMTYHDGDIQNIKHDIGILTSEAKHKMTPELTDNFLEGVATFAKTNNIEMEYLGTALGYDSKSPYGHLDYSAMLGTDPEVIGEGDNEPRTDE